MRAAPFLRSALLGLSLTACTAMGGSEDLGGGGDPPTFELTSAIPVDGAPSVPLGATITLTFNGPIDESTVDFNTLGFNYETAGSLTVNGTKLIFDPASDLLPSKTYVITISPDLKGLNGQAFGETQNPYGFKTVSADTPPPPPPSGPRPR